MKIIRPYLYALAGAIAGFIGGTIGGEILFGKNDSDFLVFGPPIVCALVAGYALWTLGKKVSKIQDTSDRTRGNFFIASRIFLVAVGVSIALHIGVSIIIPQLYGSMMAGILIPALFDVLGVWLGTMYARSKGYFRVDHDPTVIAAYVVGIPLILIAPLYYLATHTPENLVNTFDIISVLLHAVIIFIVLRYLCRNAIASAIVIK